MKMSIVRFTALFCAVSVLFVLSVLALSGQLDQLVPPILPKDSPSVKDEGKKVLILDAGHGGEDGGASGVNGTLEKELNLQYALAANDLLSACGFKVLLTRSDDRMLGDGEKGHKKLADLRYRLNLANSHPEALCGYADEVRSYSLEVEFPDSLLERLPEDKRGGALGMLAHDPRPQYHDDPDRLYGVLFAGYDIQFTVKDGVLAVRDVVPEGTGDVSP